MGYFHLSQLKYRAILKTSVYTYQVPKFEVHFKTFHIFRYTEQVEKLQQLDFSEGEV